MATQPLPVPTLLSRNMLIAAFVVLFHVAALWALQSGLMRRAVEMLVPAQLLSEFIEPPLLKIPKVEPPVFEPPPPKPVPLKRVAPVAPAPMPVAIADPTPAPAAPVGATAPQAPLPPITTPVAATVVVETAPPAPPPKAKVELPVIDADYTQNEELFRPPAVSVRLGEFGVVLLRVTVGTNGFVSQAEVAKSSGFARLDNAALQGARKVKFRPATRDGSPIDWTYLWPIKYSEPK